MRRRWIKRGLFVLLVLLAASGIAMQQSPHVDQPIPISPSTLIYTLVGVVGGWMVLGKFAERQIDARLLAPDSPLGKHLIDPLAHEMMRKSVAAEYNAQFALLRDMVDDYRREDGERMKQIRTEMIGPLIELNSSQRQVASDALKHMADSITGLTEVMRLVQPTLKVRERD